MLKDFFREWKYMSREQKSEGIYMIIFIVLFPILYAFVASFFE